jgi:hypothetical protein
VFVKIDFSALVLKGQESLGSKTQLAMVASGGLPGLPRYSADLSDNQISWVR